MEEIWEDIEGYEGWYKVSNLGNVKSLERTITRVDGINKTFRERIRKPSINGRGYYDVKLYKNGKGKTLMIHKLVAMAFLDHKPDGHNIVIDHIDNNRLNNRFDNLQLVTNRYNTSKDRTGGSSKYVGVTWFKQRNKWISRIRINDKHIHLGYFTDEKKASQIYQLALKNINKYNDNPKEFREYIRTLNSP